MAYINIFFQIIFSLNIHCGIRTTTVALIIPPLYPGQVTNVGFEGIMDFKRYLCLEVFILY